MCFCGNQTLWYWRGHDLKDFLGLATEHPYIWCILSSGVMVSVLEPFAQFWCKFKVGLVIIVLLTNRRLKFKLNFNRVAADKQIVLCLHFTLQQASLFVYPMQRIDTCCRHEGVNIHATPVPGFSFSLNHLEMLLHPLVLLRCLSMLALYAGDGGIDG